MPMVRHEPFMEEALKEARAAGEEGEVPVGAVLVKDGRIIARGGNTRERDRDPLGHAEINVIRQGCALLRSWRLTGCTLYVTLEPCPMCAGAILNARLDRVVYGASDPAAGCVGSKIHLFDLDFNCRPLVTPGILADQCAALLRDFFAVRREQAPCQRGDGEQGDSSLEGTGENSALPF